jgi:hypothetical protein
MTFYTNKQIHTNYESLESKGLKFGGWLDGECFFEVETPCGVKGDIYTRGAGFNTKENPSQNANFNIGATSYKNGCIILKYLLSLGIEKPYYNMWGDDYETLSTESKKHNYRYEYKMGKWVKNDL